MKRISFAALLVFLISCSNPEDKATGKTDSTSSGKGEEVTNSRPGPTDPGSQSNVATPDSSAGPSTNRAYGTDSNNNKK